MDDDDLPRCDACGLTLAGPECPVCPTGEGKGVKTALAVDVFSSSVFVAAVVGMVLSVLLSR